MSPENWCVTYVQNEGREPISQSPIVPHPPVYFWESGAVPKEEEPPGSSTSNKETAPAYFFPHSTEAQQVSFLSFFVQLAASLPDCLQVSPLLPQKRKSRRKGPLTSHFPANTRKQKSVAYVRWLLVPRDVHVSSKELPRRIRAQTAAH